MSRGVGGLNGDSPFVPKNTIRKRDQPYVYSASLEEKNGFSHASLPYIIVSQRLVKSGGERKNSMKKSHI